MTNMFDCDIKLSKFKLQLGYYIYFQTNTPEKGLDFLFLQLQVKYYYCHKDGFGIK